MNVLSGLFCTSSAFGLQHNGDKWTVWLANLSWQGLVMVLIVTPSFGDQFSWKAENTAGMHAYSQKQFVQAKKHFLQALSEIENPQESTPQHATTLNNLGATHEALGEYEEAELQYRQSLLIIENIQGPDHPDIVVGLNNLASLYLSKQAFGKAEPLWNRALNILESYLGPEHPHLLQTLTTLALLSLAQEQYDQSEAQLKRAIMITKKHLGLQHPQLAALLSHYAILLRITHREQEAEIVERQAASIRNDHSSVPEPPLLGPVTK